MRQLARWLLVAGLFFGTIGFGLEVGPDGSIPRVLAVLFLILAVLVYAISRRPTEEEFEGYDDDD